MEKIKKNFGFGFMRLPRNGEEVDLEQTTRMVDAFMEAGFNYFDTAHGYLGGQSETALRHCLTTRYPRESYVLTNKLSGNFFKTEADILPVFEDQLEACGVDYFDFYLMHAQSRNNFQQYKDCRAYETAMALKEAGRIRHMGISFHDTADVLDQILTEYPQIEVVQLQFNYLDFDDTSVQARECWEVCRKHGKPVIVMEPVRGGSLVNLPEQAQAILDTLQGGSNASYAIRFAASFEGIMMVLSVMSNLDMVVENCGFMKSFQPLTDAEHEAIAQVRNYFKSQNLIPCTECRYCTEVCPQGVKIPELFGCLNSKKRFNSWTADLRYENIVKESAGPAECVKCGMCENACPQHLQIRDLLEDVAAQFEKK